MSRWYEAQSRWAASSPHAHLPASLQAGGDDPPRPVGPRERPQEIQAYYEDPAVVRDYLRRRTAQPLNGVLHRRQVGFINRVIAARRPQRILEVAPGPGRLTAELDFGGAGIAVDGSAEMLAVARARLRDRRVAVRARRRIPSAGRRPQRRSRARHPLRAPLRARRRAVVSTPRCAGRCGRAGPWSSTRRTAP